MSAVDLAELGNSVTLHVGETMAALSPGGPCRVASHRQELRGVFEQHPQALQARGVGSGPRGRQKPGEASFFRAVPSSVRS